MTEHTIIRVAPENITSLWPQVAPLIESGMRGVPTHNVTDVRHALMNMSAHLWIQWSTHVEAIAVTQFMVYPRGVWLRVWLTAALKDYKHDFDAFREVLDEFKERNACMGYEWCGRVGWMRRMPNAKFEGVMMRETD